MTTQHNRMLIHQIEKFQKHPSENNQSAFYAEL